MHTSTRWSSVRTTNKSRNISTQSSTRHPWTYVSSSWRSSSSYRNSFLFRSLHIRGGTADPVVTVTSEDEKSSLHERIKNKSTLFQNKTTERKSMEGQLVPVNVTQLFGCNPSKIDTSVFSTLLQTMQEESSQYSRLLQRLMQWKEESHHVHDLNVRNIRDMFHQRAIEYTDQLVESYNSFLQQMNRMEGNVDEQEYLDPKRKQQILSFPLPHPNKVLHYMTPKIPAIRQSPEIMLRIMSATKDDVSLASYAVGIMGVLMELHAFFFDQMNDFMITYYHRLDVHKKWIHSPGDDDGHKKSHHTIVKDILADRRFEQLIECVVCGVDMTVDTSTPQSMHRQQQQQDINHGTSSSEVHGHVLDVEEDVDEIQGISVTDAAKVVLGIAAVNGHTSPILCGLNPTQLIHALALHSRHLLLLRIDRIHNQIDEQLSFEGPSIVGDLSTRRKEKFVHLIDILTTDIVSSFISFGSLKMFDSLSIQSLIHTCMNILNRKLHEVWAATYKLKIRLEDEIIDKLAMSENVQQAQDESHVQYSILQNNPFDNDSRLFHELSSHERIIVLKVVATLVVDRGCDSVHDLLDSIDNMSSNLASTLSQDIHKLADYYENKKLHSEKLVSVRNDKVAIASRNFSKTNYYLNDTIYILDIYNTITKSDVNIFLNTSFYLAPEIYQHCEYKRFQASYNLTLGQLPDTDLSGFKGLIFPDSTKAISNDNEEKDIVQVVDAADNIDQESSNITTTGVPESRENVNVETYQYLMKRIDYDSPKVISFLSVSDLCELCWTVMVLNCQCRDIVQGNAAVYLTLLGRWALRHLDGQKISNLSWAIARRLESLSSNISICEYANFATISQNIGEDSLKFRSRILLTRRAEDSSMGFTPHELGKLVASLGTIVSCSADSGESIIVACDKLSYLATWAIEQSANNVQIFAKEDLASIVWGFYELSRHSKANAPLLAYESLGEILCRIEYSLLHWFSAAEASIGERLLSSINSLPISLCTLCKLSFAVSFLSPRHLPAFALVATSLFSAKDGHLLRESCNINDISFLCTACASYKTSHLIELPLEGKETIINRFPRTVVNVLNDALVLSPLPIGCMSRLLVALGDLGASSSPDEHVCSGDRCMQIIFTLPVLDASYISRASPSLCVQLLLGLINVGKFMSSDERKTISNLCSVVKGWLPLLLPRKLYHLSRAIRKLYRSLLVSQKQGLLERSYSSVKLEEVAAFATSNQTNDDSNLVELIKDLFSALLNEACNHIVQFSSDEIELLLRTCEELSIEHTPFESATREEIRKRIGLISRTADHHTSREAALHLGECMYLLDSDRRDDY